MKSTKCKSWANCACAILGYLYSWSPANSSWRVWHRLVTVVDSMRELIHAIRCDFLSPQGTQERADQVAVSPVLCILAFSLVFTAYLSNTVVSGKSPFILQARVVLMPLVSLIGRLIACGARISVDTQTHTQTNQLLYPSLRMSVDQYAMWMM